MPISKTAFEKLVKSSESGILPLCSGILGDEHLGADAAQQTYLKFWQHAQSKPLPEHPRAWLRRVAVRICLDLLRRRRNEAAHASTASRQENVGPSARECTETKEFDTWFQTTLKTLPDGQRTVFVLRHCAGLSLRDIAVQLDRAVPTVKTQFAHACWKLHEQWEKRRS